MLKVVIVDDEVKAIELLISELMTIDDTIHILGKATTIVDAVRILSQCEPDLVFLDIQLKEGKSFEILKQLQEINFEIVFTTAYDEYAIEAFKINALDYLLKPIDEEELQRVLDKTKKKVSKDPDQILKKLNSFFEKDEGNNRLVVKEKGQISFVNKKDILYLAADGSYTKIVLLDGTSYVASKNLANYERILSRNNLLRVHRSYIININEVKKFAPMYGSAEMSNGDKVRISDNMKEEFMNRMENN